MDALRIRVPEPPPPGLLPRAYAFLQFEFTLATPYLSKDDELFHVCDNPLRKDRVFKVPMVSAAAWKGLLRWAAVRALLESSAQCDDDEFSGRRLQLTRLFGNENDIDPQDNDRLSAYLDDARPRAANLYRQRLSGVAKDGFLGGRLFFYPTFFDRMDVLVINPHDRKTKAGTKPIFFECAPPDAKGTFSVLYASLGDPEPAQEEGLECCSDLHLLVQAMVPLFLEYGFSAKRTSGFGVVRKHTPGKLYTWHRDEPFQELARLPEVINGVFAQ
jgi:CRISPR-associated protein Cmr2